MTWICLRSWLSLSFQASIWYLPSQTQSLPGKVSAPLDLCFFPYICSTQVTIVILSLHDSIPLTGGQYIRDVYVEGTWISNFGNKTQSRLDFRRSLVSGLRSSPKRDGWTCERQTRSVTAVNWLAKTNKRILTRPAVPTGEERGLLSRTAAGNRA